MSKKIPFLEMFSALRRWTELSNAAEGDERKPDFIGLRALMMIIASRPAWRDTTNEDMYGEALRYPDADVP